MLDIIVIGAGPAGMMAAITAAMKGASVKIIEKNRDVGKKLLITGKGRCNLTNNCDEQTLLANVAHNSKFMYGPFYRFNAYDTMSFFENAGVELKTERGQRVFPSSDRSIEVRNALEKYLVDLGIVVCCDEAIDIEIDELVTIKGKKDVYQAKRCIVATGGLSYPETGSSGDGFRFAERFGHRIVEPKPSLIGLRSIDNFCKELAGLTLRNVSAKFFCNKKCIYEDFGEFLFTHVGVSGPIVLSASAHFDNFVDSYVSVNLKSALTPEQLDKRLLRDFEQNCNKDIGNALEGLLPKRLLPIVLYRSGVSLSDKVHRITKGRREKLVEILQDFRINLIGKEGIKRAIITCGGVDVSEINPKTMESKLCRKLYFAGEVIDVDAYTGGFNLQIAFSTGYVAGESAAEVINENN